MMKIFIEFPYWLGDCIMTTPAVENLEKKYPEARWTIFGSKISIEIYKNHPKVERIIVDNSRSSKNRIIEFYKIYKLKDQFDIAISFRRSFSAKAVLFCIKAKEKHQYKRSSKGSSHLVIHYNNFINDVLSEKFKASHLKVYFETTKFEQPTLGINPGATYGSAKRWYPERFAKVAAELSKKYSIVIFGSNNEKVIADDIVFHLKKMQIKNYSNLTGKTSIKELCSLIGGLDLFITGDSGPMHIAAAYQVPTIALFGPTNHIETSPWMNPKCKIIRKKISCSPCMKRTCPLSHHKCMKKLEVFDVIKAIGKI